MIRLLGMNAGLDQSNSLFLKQQGPCNATFRWTRHRSALTDRTRSLSRFCRCLSLELKPSNDSIRLKRLGIIRDGGGVRIRVFEAYMNHSQSRQPEGTDRFESEADLALGFLGPHLKPVSLNKEYFKNDIGFKVCLLSSPLCVNGASVSSDRKSTGSKSPRPGRSWSKARQASPLPPTMVFRVASRGSEETGVMSESIVVCDIDPC